MSVWLVLSYRANIDGSACSQHVDDRLPELVARGVTPLLLSGPLGPRRQDLVHERTSSLAPSGLRFELRHALNRRFGRGWRYRLCSLLLLPILPFYGLEKLLLPMESEWSWCVTAAWRGLALCRRHRPELIYSTGGSVGAHLAAWYIARRTGIRWVAETQDPLVHDREWSKGRRALRLYTRLEALIFRHAHRFVFLTRAARDNAERRAGASGRGAVILPGGRPQLLQAGGSHHGDVCHLAHFGTLSGTRNLIGLLQAVAILLQEQPAWRELLRLDLYGSCDEASVRLSQDLHLSALVCRQGMLPRRQALAAMQGADCLLLVQDTMFFSSETIPSKVYEYLLSGRPILGLVHDNEELAALLRDRGHWCAPVDDPVEMARCLGQMLTQWQQDAFAPPLVTPPPPTVSEAVEQLMTLARTETDA
ncbi:MAG: hypothetical protein BWK76_26795 [Desulfobulbaceae bacterium A2]|nr:MAG: hypothetical protein BWK76_26795 [Desulfobulbaceae bacterium A2]